MLMNAFKHLDTNVGMNITFNNNSYIGCPVFQLLCGFLSSLSGPSYRTGVRQVIPGVRGRL